MRLKILAVPHLGLWGWHRVMLAGTAASSIFCEQNAPRKPTTILGLTSTLQVFYSHSITRSVLPLQVPGDAWQWDTSIPTQRCPLGWSKGTLLWPLRAQGWHPLMVCDPWHGTDRGNETTECHQGADTSAGRGPGSPGPCPQMTPALVM